MVLLINSLADSSRNLFSLYFLSFFVFLYYYTVRIIWLRCLNVSHSVSCVLTKIYFDVSLSIASSFITGHIQSEWYSYLRTSFILGHDLWYLIYVLIQYDLKILEFIFKSNNKKQKKFFEKNIVIWLVVFDRANKI